MWSGFRFNEPFTGEFPESIGGVALSQEYIDFMMKHNGGEGDIGDSWLVLFKVEELLEINEEYREDLPDGNCIIGSNGGGELFGVNADGNYFIVPELIEEEYMEIISNNIENLPLGINNFWNRMK